MQRDWGLPNADDLCAISRQLCTRITDHELLSTHIKAENFLYYDSLASMVADHFRQIKPADIDAAANAVNQALQLIHELAERGDFVSATAVCSVLVKPNIRTLIDLLSEQKRLSSEFMEFFFDFKKIYSAGNSQAVYNQFLPGEKVSLTASPVVVPDVKVFLTVMTGKKESKDTEGQQAVLNTFNHRKSIILEDARSSQSLDEDRSEIVLSDRQIGVRSAILASNADIGKAERSTAILMRKYIDLPSETPTNNFDSKHVAFIRALNRDLCDTLEEFTGWRLAEVLKNVQAYLSGKGPGKDQYEKDIIVFIKNSADVLKKMRHNFNAKLNKLEVAARNGEIISQADKEKLKGEVIAKSISAIKTRVKILQDNLCDNQITSMVNSMSSSSSPVAAGWKKGQKLEDDSESRKKMMSHAAITSRLSLSSPPASWESQEVEAPFSAMRNMLREKLDSNDYDIEVARRWVEELKAASMSDQATKALALEVRKYIANCADNNNKDLLLEITVMVTPKSWDKRFALTRSDKPDDGTSSRLPPRNVVTPRQSEPSEPIKIPGQRKGPGESKE